MSFLFGLFFDCLFFFFLHSHSLRDEQKKPRSREPYSNLAPKEWVSIFKAVMKIQGSATTSGVSLSFDNIVRCTCKQLKLKYPNQRFQVPLNYVRWFTATHNDQKQAVTLKMITRFYFFVFVFF